MQHLCRLILPLIGLGTAVVFSGCASSVSFQTGQHPGTFAAQITKTVRLDYLLSLPEEYGKDKSKQWPLVLFLHGSGERGSDLNKVIIHGPPKLVAKGKQFPFILVSPQCPDNQRWEPEVLNALLDNIIALYSVDKSRMYCTGLSMGGFGTWDLACNYPERFAAIIPVCGGGEPFKASALKKIPVWVFHGAKDPVVSPERSQEMVNAIQKTGGNVKYTLYPDAGHDSWTATYANPELYEWMLAQHR
ncbi:MAG: prolyl oligopeptidase family serine peptidase [Ignavibacteriales bacterium]|nr:prolyl oligopeptidase family serine peptidase [Ignavibacteriales bacterium]